jgi:hypothetical protein
MSAAVRRLEKAWTASISTVVCACPSLPGSVLDDTTKLHGRRLRRSWPNILWNGMPGRESGGRTQTGSGGGGGRVGRRFSMLGVNVADEVRLERGD